MKHVLISVSLQEGDISKYKLWKTLHELGFRYNKLSGERKALVERVDIVNQRIN
jgi:transposase